MGIKYTFACPDCDYSVMVSGERDCGMVAVVQTMVCKDCQELVDVLVGRYGKDGPTGDPDYDQDLGVCPDCQGQNVAPWPEEHPCPRCKSPMVIDPDGLEMLWD
jgi:uncharacterized paraquat-inducible protein A